jgi:hypothetical protein
MKKFLVLITPLIGCATAQPVRCSPEPSCCACYSQELLALRQIQTTLDRIEEKKAPKYGDFELGTAGGSWGVAHPLPPERSKHEPKIIYGPELPRDHELKTVHPFEPNGDGGVLVPASGAINATPSAMLFQDKFSGIGTVDGRFSQQATSAVKVPEGCKYDGWNFDCKDKVPPLNFYGH